MIGNCATAFILTLDAGTVEHFAVCFGESAHFLGDSVVGALQTALLANVCLVEIQRAWRARFQSRHREVACLARLLALARACAAQTRCVRPLNRL